MNCLNKSSVSCCSSSLVAGIILLVQATKRTYYVNSYPLELDQAKSRWRTVIGVFLKRGDNVSYVPADSQAVYESIVTVSHHAHEVWQSTFW